MLNYPAFPHILRDIVFAIFTREICIRSILRDIPCSSIMHQIFSKQESAGTHRHPLYFPSLHLVHHYNSVLKTSYGLSATPPSTQPHSNNEHSWVHVVFPTRNFRDNLPLYLYLVHYVEKVESRADPSDVQDREIHLYLPSFVYSLKVRRRV